MCPPQANGMAESAVKTAKKLITTAAESNSDTWLAVLAQRNTPSEGMMTSPAQRLFCRQTKGFLPLTAKQVEHNTATIQAVKINFNPIQARLFFAPVARGGTLCPLLKTIFLLY